MTQMPNPPPPKDAIRPDPPPAPPKLACDCINTNNCSGNRCEPEEYCRAAEPGSTEKNNDVSISQSGASELLSRCKRAGIACNELEAALDRANIH